MERNIMEHRHNIIFLQKIDQCRSLFHILCLNIKHMAALLTSLGYHRKFDLSRLH